MNENNDPPVYYGIPTDLGLAKIADLSRPINLCALALGDAEYDPTPGQTALVSERARLPISSLTPDRDNPPWKHIVTIVPPDVGGFRLHEAGVYDTDGDLIVICKLDGSYKPVYSQGLSREIGLEIILQFAAGSTVNLVIDPYVVTATRAWTTEQINALGLGLAAEILHLANRVTKNEIAKTLEGNKHE